MMKTLSADTARLPHLLDAIRYLKERQLIHNGVLDTVDYVMNLYFRYLERPDKNGPIFMDCGVSGIQYEIHMATIAGFLNKANKMVWYLDRSKSRLLLVEEDGRLSSQCEQEVDPSRVMTAWSILARVSESYHRSDLWGAYPRGTTGDSAICRMAAHYLDESSAAKIDRFAMNDLAAHCPKLGPLVQQQQATPAITK